MHRASSAAPIDPSPRRSSASSTATSGATTAGARRRSCPSQERVEDFYASDVSISAGFFGTLVDHTGVFGEAERFAAAAQGADRTMFSVHGSSGSNWIVLRMLALERSGRARARRAQHPPLGHQRAQGLRPRLPLPARRPTSRASRRCCRRASTRSPRGLRPLPRGARRLYTSPTYEGLAANTPRIAAAVHAASEHAMVIVDEAWGGHLHFHPELPLQRDGGGRRRLRAVDPQARRRPAADRPDPLARGPRGLRADGGGLPRVRDHLAELPPAGLRRRGRAHAGGAGRAARWARRSRARAS